MILHTCKLPKKAETWSYVVRDEYVLGLDETHSIRTKQQSKLIVVYNQSNTLNIVTKDIMDSS